MRWVGADGATVAEQRVGTAMLVRLLSDVPEGAAGLEFRTTFTPDEDGEWRVGVVGVGRCALELDGATVLDETFEPEEFDVHQVFASPPQHTTSVRLRAGQPVEAVVRFRWPAGGFIFRVGLVVGPPVGTPEDELARAVELARGADVAVVVVGTSEDVESEGFDRTSLALPGRQDELVRAVAAVNPRTVVVVNAGAPVELPWRDEVAAVLVSWFPGMEFGNALADVLLGAVEPGGRLPTTWPRALSEAPVREVVPTDGRLDYTEGLHVGSRAYLRAGAEPAFWFGAGLGYTTWEWQAIESDGATATVRLRNTGDRPGKQVVQVYAARPDSAVERPVRWLAGFAVVAAGPGETVDVPVRVEGRTLRHWTPEGWAVEPGDVVLSSGPSAGDQHVSTSVAVSA
jgi:beta-glucosidase